MPSFKFKLGTKVPHQIQIYKATWIHSLFGEKLHSNEIPRKEKRLYWGPKMYAQIPLPFRLYDNSRNAPLFRRFRSTKRQFTRLAHNDDIDPFLGFLPIWNKKRAPIFEMPISSQRPILENIWGGTPNWGIAPQNLALGFSEQFWPTQNPINIGFSIKLKKNNRGQNWDFWNNREVARYKPNCPQEKET